MRAIFVNRFYWPAETATAQLLTDLAEALAARGWTIAIVTGHASPSLPRREQRHGVEIYRVGRRMAATQSLARRAVDFALFHLCALPAIWRLSRKGDPVVALTDPPLIGITTTVAATFRSARPMHWVQDIYPEIIPAVTPTLAAKLLCRFLSVPRNLAWRRAAAVVTLSHEMGAQIQQSGTKSDRIHIVPNWAPRGISSVSEEAKQAVRKAWGVGDRFVISYSGNFGRVHDLSAILEVAHDLRDDPRFIFVFIGNGAAFASLRQGAEQRALTNILFFPSRPRHELSASLGAADVQLVSVRAGCERFVFPSKLYGIAAAGRPVLLLAAIDSELAQIVRREELGLVFRPNDVAGIGEGLRALVRERERADRYAAATLRFAAANGGADAAAQRWATLLPAGPASAAPSSPEVKSPLIAS